MRKGLITQVPDPIDRRQRVLAITERGTSLWDEVPDPRALVPAAGFDGLSEDDAEAVARVFRDAAERVRETFAEDPAR